jgi:acetylornithine aminotransferase
MENSGLLMAYKPLPISFARGEGVWLYDHDGKAYLDALSGIAVCGLGHAHPEISQTLAEQAATLIHTSNIVHIEHQEALAERLLPLAGMERVFFCNSGAEANEAALKIARLFARQKSIPKPSVIVTEGAFHGRTIATLSASGNRKIQAGFEPLLPGYSRAEFGNIDAMRDIVKRNPQAVAVLVEPIQGEAGIIVPPPGYLKALRAMCDEYELLLMLDEVQTGNGRCGRWYHCQYDEVLPDVLTTAKGLGNGMPIGACMARGHAAHLLAPGMHASTFGGNPLCCAVARNVVEIIERDHLVAAAEKKGMSIRERLTDALQSHPDFCQVRGSGLMIGIELRRPCAQLVSEALERGLLINVTGKDNNVIRLLPPLIINEEEITLIVDGLRELIPEQALA